MKKLLNSLRLSGSELLSLLIVNAVFVRPMIDGRHWILQVIIEIAALLSILDLYVILRDSKLEQDDAP